MYDEMFAYVKRILSATYKKDRVRTKVKVDRYGHSERVFCWAKKLAGEFGQEVDMEALLIAAIFHDVAYDVAKYPKPHGEVGAGICRKYLKGKGFPEERIEKVCYLVERHSDKKEMMHQEDTPIELVLLMEADTMDGTGAQSILMDVWQVALEDDVDYMQMYDHIMKFTYEQTKYNPMRTEAAKRYWAEKQKLIELFVSQLEEDISLKKQEG